MKGRHGDVILVFLFLIKHVSARQPPHIDTSDLLGHLNKGSGNINPLIVYINTKMQRTATEDSDFDLFIRDDGLRMNDYDFVNEEEDKEQAKLLLYNYLLKDSSVDSQDPDDPRPALRQALRKRCQAVVKCTSSCPRKGKKDYCIPNCKAVFDKLDLCYPTQSDKKKPKKPKRQQKNECDDDSNGCGATKEDECKEGSDECATKNQTWGKTMPPKWLK